MSRLNRWTLPAWCISRRRSACSRWAPKPFGWLAARGFWSAVCMICLSACSPLTGSMLPTPVEYTDLRQQAPWVNSWGGKGLAGTIELLSQLVFRDLADPAFPFPEGEDETVELRGTERVSDIISLVERSQGWAFDYGSRRFYRATATHSVDDPDPFGRPGARSPAPTDVRQMISFRIRFVRLSGGLDRDGVDLGVVLTELHRIVPAGVLLSFSNGVERSFREGIISSASSRPSEIETTRRTVASGVQVQALASTLPGGRFRVDGELSISSFVGEGLDRGTVDVPLQCDGVRGVPLTLARFRSADLATRIAWSGLNFSGRLGGDTLAVQVVVD